MPEETTETFENLDDAFRGVDSKEIAEQESGVQEVAADAEIETKVDVEIEQKDEVAKEEQPEKATGEDVWGTLGHPEFSGKTEKEIAAMLKQKQEDMDYHNLLYGQQSNELGTLRKEVEDLKKQVTETPKVERETKVSLSEGDLEEFQELLNSDPVAALNKYYGPEVDNLVQKRLEEAMTSTDGPVGQKLAEHLDTVERQQLYSRHPDAEEYVNEMTALDEQKSLGKQKRPYEDLYQLGKLWKSKDSIWEPTYQLMVRYPQMPFSEAHAIANAQRTSQAESETEKEKVIGQVESIKQATPKKTTNTRSENVEVFSSVDDAFDSVPVED